MPSVTLPWVQDLPLKMQSLLFSGLRGPDVGDLRAIKAAVRWLRPVTQINADASTEYMQVDVLPDWQLVRRELEYGCSVHYYGHLLHTFEIIGYRHPDPKIRGHAYFFYCQMAELLHLRVEAVTEMNTRLADK